LVRAGMTIFCLSALIQMASAPAKATTITPATRPARTRSFGMPSDPSSVALGPPRVRHPERDPRLGQRSGRLHRVEHRGPRRALSLSPRPGVFYHLYLMVDVWSRKVVEAAGVGRQPVLRGPVSDGEVSARLPGALLCEPGARAQLGGRLCALVQRGAPAQWCSLQTPTDRHTGRDVNFSPPEKASTRQPKPDTPSGGGPARRATGARLRARPKDRRGRGESSLVTSRGDNWLETARPRECVLGPRPDVGPRPVPPGIAALDAIKIAASARLICAGNRTPPFGAGTLSSQSPSPTLVG
jgi:hypothetical protein